MCISGASPSSHKKRIISRKGAKTQSFLEKKFFSELGAYALARNIRAEMLPLAENLRATRLFFLLTPAVFAIQPVIVHAGHENRDVTTISVDRLKLLIDSGEKFFLVDLRPAKAFQEKSLPGARSIPEAELEKRLKEIPKSGRVVVYGERASNDIADAVFQLFEDERYRNITVLLEGFEGWEKRKFPLETKRK